MYRGCRVSLGLVPPPLSIRISFSFPHLIIYELDAMSIGGANFISLVFFPKWVILSVSDA